MRVEEIGKEGQLVEPLLEKDWLENALSEQHTSDLHVSQNQKIQIKAYRLDTEVYLHGSFSLHLEAECSSCLSGFELEVPVLLSLSIRPKPSDSRTVPVELELKSEDLNEYFYEGDSIDLDEVLREQIILSLPMYPKCSEHCRGLCAVCGSNLNKSSCGCQHREMDPRWAVLKTLNRSTHQG